MKTALLRSVLASNVPCPDNWSISTTLSINYIWLNKCLNQTELKFSRDGWRGKRTSQSFLGTRHTGETHRGENGIDLKGPAYLPRMTKFLIIFLYHLRGIFSFSVFNILCFTIHSRTREMKCKTMDSMRYYASFTPKIKVQ